MNSTKVYSLGQLSQLHSRAGNQEFLKVHVQESRQPMGLVRPIEFYDISFFDRFSFSSIKLSLEFGTK